MNAKLKKRLKRGAIILAGLAAFLLLTFGVVVYVTITPKQVTPIVFDIANQYLDAGVQFDEVDITLISTFPNVGIRLKNGSLTKTLTDSALQYASSDTLLLFSSCIVSFNPLKYLFNGDLEINEIRLEQPDIYAHIDSTGKFNWDIFPVTKDTTTVKDASPGFDWQSLHIRQLQIKDAVMVYNDEQAGLSLAARNFNLELSANLQKGRIQAKIKKASVLYDNYLHDMSLALEEVRLQLSGRLEDDILQASVEFGMMTSLWNQGKQLTDSLPIQFSAQAKQFRQTQQIELTQANLSLAGVVFDGTGHFDLSDTINKTVRMNVDYNLHASSIPELLAAMPSGMAVQTEKLVTTGELKLKGSVNGMLGNESYPIIQTTVQLTDGSLRNTETPNKQGIKNLELDGEAYIDLSRQTASSFQLNKLLIQSASTTIDMSGTADDLLSRPHLSVGIKGDVDFTRLAKDLSLTDSMDMHGQIRIDLTGESFLDDILHSDYGKMKANGTVDINDLLFDYPAKNLSVMTPGLHVRLGSNYKDSTWNGTVRDVLFRGNITSDSVKIKSEIMLANTGDISVTFSASPPRDSLSIAPVMANVRTKNLALSMDSVRVRANGASGTVVLLPLSADRTKPEYTLRFTLDTLRARMTGFNGSINNGKLTVRLHKQLLRTPADSAVRRSRRTLAAATDTTVNPADTPINAAVLPDALSTGSDSSVTATMSRLRRTDTWNWDSLNRENVASGALVNMRLESLEARTALRQWEVNGSLGVDNARIQTPFFPVRTQIVKGTIDFSSDSVNVKSLQVRAGTSELTLNGEISGVRQALLNNRQVKAKFSLDADTLDVNELIRAMAAGSVFSTQDRQTQDSITVAVLDASKEMAATVVDTTVTGVFVVPRNIDLEIRARIKKAYYSKLEIERINTQILVRNQAIQMSRMNVLSNVGNMRLAFAYQASDAKSAHVGLDMQLWKIQVRELLETFPMFDSLTPMLRSFDGTVDCKMTATSDLDSLMNVDFKTTAASCYLTGKDMVLLDGETFSEIAGMLYFKNKKRNLIDSLSVDMIMRDNCLMVFPFLLNIDRYRVAVGGTQYLDLSFDYHISVLKSPVPVKLGLNLTGSPGKIKIHLAKPLYKNMDDPVRRQSMMGQLLNVRNELEKHLQEEIEHIIEMPDAAQQTRRRLSAQPSNMDSLRRRFFMSDTAGVAAAVDTAQFSIRPVAADSTVVE